MSSTKGSVACLTNSRELFAEHVIQDARPANLGLHQHHAGMIGNDLSDYDGFRAQRVPAHVLDNFIRCVSGNDRNQLAFIGHIKRIESQDFAGPLDGFAHRNISFLQQHSDLRPAGNFIQRSCYATASWIAQAVNGR